MSDPKPYQPSNGSEGDWFMSLWCGRCRKDRPPGRPCRILARTMFYSPGDKEYPAEWQRTDAGPVCTAFQSNDEPKPVSPRRDEIRDRIAARRGQGTLFGGDS